MMGVARRSTKAACSAQAGATTPHRPCMGFDALVVVAISLHLSSSITDLFESHSM